MKQVLFEAKFEQYSQLKKFRDMENGEYILKNYVSRYIDTKLKTASMFKLDSDAQKIFSD
jgi:hypothetical protein